MAASEAIQTIPRLTPLADVLVVVDAEVKPVTQRAIDVSAATGRTLATDALAPARPASALALQDGWAISADETLGAGGYAPSPLMRTPSRVEAGQAMPAGTLVTLNAQGSYDPDGNALTYAVVAQPQHGTLSGTAPNLTYTPTPGYYGPDSFTFKVNDGRLDSLSATVSITVKATLSGHGCGGTAASTRTANPEAARLQAKRGRTFLSYARKRS